MKKNELEVRCCCNPEKLLGYLPVVRRSIGYANFQKKTNYLFFKDWADVDSINLETVTFPIDKITFSKNRNGEIISETKLAIKAEGMELEDLRNISGFREA